MKKFGGVIPTKNSNWHVGPLIFIKPLDIGHKKIGRLWLSETYAEASIENIKDAIHKLGDEVARTTSGLEHIDAQINNKSHVLKHKHNVNSINDMDLNTLHEDLLKVENQVKKITAAMNSVLNKADKKVPVIKLRLLKKSSPEDGKEVETCFIPLNTIKTVSKNDNNSFTTIILRGDNDYVYVKESPEYIMSCMNADIVNAEVEDSMPLPDTFETSQMDMKVEA